MTAYTSRKGYLRKTSWGDFQFEVDDAVALLVRFSSEEQANATPLNRLIALSITEDPAQLTLLPLPLGPVYAVSPDKPWFTKLQDVAEPNLPNKFHVGIFLMLDPSRTAANFESKMANTRSYAKTVEAYYKYYMGDYIDVQVRAFGGRGTDQPMPPVFGKNFINQYIQENGLDDLQ